MFFKRLCQKHGQILNFWKIRSRCYTDRPPDGKSAFKLRCEEWVFVASNVAIPAYLMCLSDLMEQDCENHELWGEPMPGHEFDYQRCARMAMVAAAMGPIQYFGYIHMDRLLPGHTLRVVVKKIIADQLLMAPVCITFFFYFACYLEQKTFEEFTEELEHKFGRVYMMDWMFWPIAQYFSFRYLPPSLRTFYAFHCTLIYDIMLCYIKHARH